MARTPLTPSCISRAAFYLHMRVKLFETEIICDLSFCAESLRLHNRDLIELSGLWALLLLVSKRDFVLSRGIYFE